MLNMGYTNHKSFSNLVHFFWTSVPPSGDYSNQLSAWSCALTTNFVGLGIMGRSMGSQGGKAMGEKRRHVGTHIQPNKVHTV